MSRLQYYLIFGLLLQPVVESQILLGAPQIEAPGNFSTACNATFSEDIACNITLYEVALGQLFPTVDDLSSICTETCLEALETLRAQQILDCSSSDLVVTAGETYPPSLTTDILLFTYNYTCVQDPHNHNTTSTEVCSDCNLLIQQSQLDSPLGWDDESASMYSSLTSSCGVTKYPVTSPNPYSLGITSTVSSTANPSTTTAAYSCTSMYTIQEEDTCSSISESQQVATFYLMQANNLPGYCSELPGPGTSLCIPQSCKLYTVAANDTCHGIVQSYNMTFSSTQLISWNPNINKGCSNLNQVEGFQICVSYPGLSTAASTGSASVTTPIASIPTNLAPNTTTDCGAYYLVLDGDECASISIAMGISLADFYFLNPMVNSTCGNLWTDTYYCVKAVGNIATYPGYGGTTTTKDPCSQLYAPASCFVTTYPTTTPFAWPAVGTMTTTALLTNYTSLADLPLAPGTEGSCPKYAKYYESSTDINSCGAIAYFYDVEISDIVAWNPSLTYDENNTTSCEFLPGYRYCVAGTTTGSNGTSSISPNGLCGAENTNYTCEGSAFGDCCSEYGNCGSTSDFCGVGCQSLFGSCTTVSATLPTATNTATPTATLSPDGSCGGDNGYTCESPNCCSESGYCGSTSDFCGVGCQSAFGICSTSPTATTGTVPAAPSQTISSNGGCGNDYNDWTCAGSAFGNCCSQYGFCGSESTYCDVGSGCQATFGECTS
ncbi:uncharacterized protein EAE98_002443 [Botrytis deweyae]|uniref:Carbohydrate-binding module family 18 protein n=1 Tax=Botrytis deweyae TaxID=2478750 RepID=A0ABQ7IXB1_9HELO|nr:uncharacterized protein EAE98_002443 [Botrytis deweyae]KAF7936224.1 hypothetical protein EAE98_002443 [Botrytis deweyae]